MNIDDLIKRARYDLACLVPEANGARREFEREFTQYAHELIEAVRTDTAWHRAKRNAKRFMHTKWGKQ